MELELHIILSLSLTLRVLDNAHSGERDGGSRGGREGSGGGVGVKPDHGEGGGGEEVH